MYDSILGLGLGLDSILDHNITNLRVNLKAVQNAIYKEHNPFNSLSCLDNL